jgi:hypothetical protein
MSERGKRSPRASARRATWRALDEIKKTADNMRGWWSTTGKVYIPPEERPADDPNGWYRDRQSGEYPENQRRYWAGTVAGIDKMIMDLQALREACVEEFNKTPE